MELPKSLTTVTPISKYLALVLFILLPFVGFYAGMKYQKSITPNMALKSNLKLQPRNLGNATRAVPTSIPILNFPSTIISTPFTPITKPSDTSDYLITLPSLWKYNHGVIEDENGTKIGDMVNSTRIYLDGETCSSSQKASADNNMTENLGQWDELINGTSWNVTHIKVACLGDCDWLSYCAQKANRLFFISFHIDTPSELINQTLSTFKFL